MQQYQNPDLPPQIKTAQSLIQESSKGYLMAVIMEDGLYWITNEPTTAYGLAAQVMHKLEDAWHGEDETDKYE